MEDIWKCDEEIYKVYTKSEKHIKKIIEEANGKVCNEYQKKGKTIAWDLEFNKDKLKIVKKIMNGKKV